MAAMSTRAVAQKAALPAGGAAQVDERHAGKTYGTANQLAGGEDFVAEHQCGQQNAEKGVGGR